MTRRRTVPLVLAALVLGLGGPIATSPSAGATSPPQPPSVRLINPTSNVTLFLRRHHRYYLDYHVFVASVGGAFELWGQRPTYADPVGLSQVVRNSAGDVTSSTPISEAPEPDMGRGINSFFQVTLAKNNGTVIRSGSRWFCPESYQAQRLTDSASTVPSYPSVCWAGPWTRGAVWGIDDGWAVPFGVGFGGHLNIAPGDYQLTVSIKKPYRYAFGIPAADASVTTTVTAKDTTTSARQLRRGAAAESAPTQEAAQAPIITPPAGTLPDIEALPAWGIVVENHRKSGQSYLNFGATAWNEGPGPLDVEGFRDPTSPLMDAFQYFYDGDTAVAKQPVGKLEYDSTPGHDHWHFRDFAAYSLLNSEKKKVLDSGKEAFCLAPTDPIDLTVPKAIWSPWLTDLATACGEKDSLWIREVLEAGWGDTYAQYRPGQSFEITDLPNGTYYIKVHANPDEVLFESSLKNNVALREVRIHGQPGDRSVTVPPYLAIDTEHTGCGLYC